MAKAKGVIEGEGQFLIVAHQEEGHLVYETNRDGSHHSVQIPPNVEVVAEEVFLSYAPFVRDFQHGKLQLRRSDTVPTSELPPVSDKFDLTPTQKELARRVAYSETLPAHVWDAIRVHELMREGMVPDGVLVTKTYLKREHTTFLRATIDLEKRHKNRSKIVKELEGVVEAIEAL